MPGDESGAAVVGRPGWARRPQRSPADAVDKLDLLIQGHFLLHQIRTLIGGERRVIPGVMRRRRLRRFLGVQRRGTQHQHHEPQGGGAGQTPEFHFAAL